MRSLLPSINGFTPVDTRPPRSSRWPCPGSSSSRFTFSFSTFPQLTVANCAHARPLAPQASPARPAREGEGARRSEQCDWQGSAARQNCYRPPANQRRAACLQLRGKLVFTFSRQIAASLIAAKNPQASHPALFPPTSPPPCVKLACRLMLSSHPQNLKRK